MSAVLRLDGVEVRYGSTRALAGVDLTVDAGQRVALVGPSGAGKSTLLGLVNGSVLPTAGSVQVLGDDVAALRGRAQRQLRARVGTVHQHLELVGQLRVVHNVNAGRLSSWPAWRAAWSLVHPQGLPEVLAALDRVGLADRVFERTERLSGGQRQRVALARLLVQQPELVLADEPASALDPVLAERALALLAGLSADRGGALIASLHDPALALRHCTRVVGLVEGRVVLDAPAAALTVGDLADFYGAPR
ncbi:ATP-binding cassette domain-containing protein [Modestobacter sp. VKM Ac-2980]|uniref:phosphonate ABC transporter ATP-binding protein n=1 Tax=Modestobacter sp. VKM Ac-2980 TaxID=3004134 RepID=UPI0022AB70E3|nr:ATP-binding cassette domain-containing protein [Modestobacter sp. VKM Ac-2980]MCZ2842769.1 ATP-binding cassette domain-containing protein [Modestobacter sp. VKM Ac-2980]